MAGAYVGLGIILIFTLGNPGGIRHPAALVAGAHLRHHMTLVIIAGSELFTVPVFLSPSG